MRRFNINDYMYIQIDPEGWQHLSMTVGIDYIIHCIESRKVSIDGQDWYRLQCHNVFDLFPIQTGARCFFKTTVMFDDYALKD